MTTLVPRPAYTLDELNKLYPKDLQLTQVQILLRHGERTPVGARFRNTGLHPYWPYCDSINRLTSVIRDADGQLDSLTWRRRLETLDDEGQAAYATGPKGEQWSVCQPGELTNKGRETTLALGQRIRRLYVDQLGFLPGTLDSKNLSGVALRSTPIPRARESTEQAFTGLYPVSARESGLPPPTLVTRYMTEETLFPNENSCKRFREIGKAFAARAAELYNDGPELAYINKKIGKWMPQDSPVVKVDSHPRLSGVMDHVNATLAHGKATRLPSEFYDEKVRKDIDRIVTEEWFAGYQESNEYRKLGIGAAVGDLTTKMVAHVRGDGRPEDAFKISLNGCHDTSIAATLTSLGAFDYEKDSWPNFTSNIAFELFKGKDGVSPASNSTSTGAIWPSKEKTWWSSLFSSSTPAQSISARTSLQELPESEKAKLDGYFVRVRYNDRPITLPACKPPGKHWKNDESFCTLTAFKEAADSFTPKDWKRECGENTGLPAMRPEIERPPGVVDSSAA